MLRKVIRWALLLLSLGGVVALLALLPGDTARGAATAGLPQSVAGCWETIPSAGGDVLYGVSGRAADDVWAAGYTNVATGTAGLIQHWDGNQWHLLPSPNPGLDNQFSGIGSIKE